MNRIFAIQSRNDFEEVAMDIFRYQAEKNPVYSNYLSLLKINYSELRSISDIPFLPIEIFKSDKVLTDFGDAEEIFLSSSTGGTVQSRHYVPDPLLYEESFKRSFELFYGKPKDYCILALLPSYLEREGSSLIYMMDKLIQLSCHPKSGFYLNELEDLSVALHELKKANQKTLLCGVTFALLDFAELFSMEFPDLIVMETGGMKGRREELVREDVHSKLKAGFSVAEIHSEYGMTELLSQGYSSGNGIFRCPPWMQLVIREPNDPFHLIAAGKTGGVNIIDLANLDSCAFIETQDLGKVFSDGSFEILGRFDSSDLRGCNLMVL